MNLMKINLQMKKFQNEYGGNPKAHDKKRWDGKSDLAGKK